MKPRISIINSSFSKETLFLSVPFGHETRRIVIEFTIHEKYKQLITYHENIPAGPSYNKVF